MNTADVLEALAAGLLGFVLVAGIAIRIAIKRLRRLVPSEHEVLPGGKS